MSSSTVDLIKFSFLEASKMTNGFRAAREGEFASRCDGVLDCGKKVVVTRFHRQENLENEFETERTLLRKYPSQYLAPLIGYCDDRQTREMMLVHEYMGSTTLADYLSPEGPTLPFNEYLIILIDVAEGMRYLHDEIGVSEMIVHRNIKPENIHIGDDGHAKLSDFGYARMGPANQSHSSISSVQRGTKGYMDLHDCNNGRFSRRGDVYSLGIVILQVLCKRPACDETLRDDQQMLGDWAIKCYDKGRFNDIIDAGIKQQLQGFDTCLKDLTKLAYSCLIKPNDRPKAAALVEKLKSILNKWVTSPSTSNSDTQLQARPHTSRRGWW